ncbi:hypothetical protein N7456_000953 [Penicillium angulare]|uniref:Uncharacterized protein n=1 Tax=Penicillium angulare TaxID=116970 RepID=A0A9W9GE44_9EURO|nr:hypothetical protein N7456_000953 [Penicillium angulare]
MESEEDDTRDFSLSYSQTTNPGPSSPASSHSNHNDADQSYESSESEFSNRLLSRPLQMHSYTTRVALSALIDHQIIVVEYGSQAQYRYGYEEVLILVEWAVPDDQLQRASQVLIEAEFPRVDHGERQERLGCWGLQSLPHDLDGSTRGRIHLLPLSLTGLTLEETVEVPSTFAPKLYLRTPKPPRYFLSLLKSLLKLRIGDRSRNRVIKDLKCFISHYILFAPPADTPGEVLDEIMAKETDEEYAIRSDGSIRDVLA